MQVGQELVHYFTSEKAFFQGKISMLSSDKGYYTAYDDGEWPHALEEKSYQIYWAFLRA